MSLEEKVDKKYGEGTFKKFSKAREILPLLETEDVEYHLDEIVKAYPDIARKIEEKPYLKDALRKYVKDSLYEHKYDLYGAKFVDSVDRIAAGVELGSLLFGGVGEEAIKTVTEPIEWVTKGLYTGYYLYHTKDWTSVPYFTVMEVLSLLPVVGEAFDISNVYLNRLRKQIRKKAAGNFLEKIVMAEA